MPASSTPNRYATGLKWVSIGAIVMGLLVLARVVPVDRAVGLLLDRVRDLGFWGPVVYGVVYVIAALMFVPGAALTLGGGALFGPLWGTLVVSAASTVVVAVSFLMARYLAREEVTRLAGRYPKFKAFDRAMGRGGWKLIALLRLSPVVPFSVVNYLFGLTRVRFWPHVATSWWAMLPGTFMYAYLGYIGRVGITAATGAGPPGGAVQWTLLIVGLAATVAFALYLVHLARHAIGRQINTGMNMAPQEPSLTSEQPETPPRRWPWDTVLAGVLAVCVLITAACAYFKPGTFAWLFGPPVVELAEVYQDNPSGPKFDHTLMDQILHKHVAAGGWVDYAALKKNSGDLDRYIAALALAPFDPMGRDEKLALLINAYNAFTLRLILDYYPLDSIKDIPAAKRWDDPRWRVGPYTWSLSQIEHQQIRPKFRQPRIHFALVCAAVGCPPLRGEAYTADRLEQQLEDQTRYIHSQKRWFYIAPDHTGVVHLTNLYNWYGGDFEQVSGSILDFVADYSPPLRRAMDQTRVLRIQWIEYDWSLNDKGEGSIGRFGPGEESNE